MTDEQAERLIGILERHTSALEQISQGVELLLRALISAEPDNSEEVEPDQLRTMDDAPLPQ